MKKLIGTVAVDSGQILICDPCYVDSHWVKEDFKVISKYQHIDGTILIYPTDFPHYDFVIPKYGKTMNQMVEDYEAVQLPREIPDGGNFSYNTCCQATLTEEGYGHLNFPKGFEGLGVVSSTGYGDGVYPVYAEIDDRTKRVKSITIDFMDEDEDDQPKNSWGL